MAEPCPLRAVARFGEAALEAQEQGEHRCDQADQRQAAFTSIVEDIRVWVDRADANPINEDSVDFTVTFSEPVNGIGPAFVEIEADFEVDVVVV